MHECPLDFFDRRTTGKKLFVFRINPGLKKITNKKIKKKKFIERIFFILFCYLFI